MEKVIEFLIFLLGDFLLSNYHVYCWKKLNNQSIKINKKYFLPVILTTIALNSSSYIFIQPFRMIIITVLLIAINYFLMSIELRKSLVLVIMSQMILALAEFSFVIICSLCFGNEIYQILFEPLPLLLLNIYILTISCIIVKTKFIRKLYNLFFQNTKNKENIVYPIIIIFILIIATVESHMKLPLPIVLITNVIMAIVFIAIIITSTKIKDNYEKISSKYETSISSLKEYEVMIDKFRVDTHENKNQFLTVRNMLKEDSDKEKVIKYIDKLVDNKIKDNDKIMKQTAKIPSGGLRATIYSKLCLMEKLNIKYSLNISRDVHTTNLIDLDEDLTLKICKILGVFLDNAIEAVKKLRKKEISIEIYIVENYLYIDITNNFKGKIELNKITEAKYTTKGEGHGYGLSLVSQLIEEEKTRLENEKSINRDTFTQTLKIKM